MNRRSKETPLWGTPGVVCYRKSPPPQAQQIVIWDLDMTAANTDPHMESAVIPWHDEHARQLDVPQHLVRQATGPFEERFHVRSIEFLWVELAIHLGELFPLVPSALLEMVIKPYLAKWLEIEARIRPFDGIANAMAKFQKRWPSALNIVITNCPTWMGLGRCHHTGILPYVSGIIGVEPHIPELDQGHPYWPCVQYALDWVRGIVNPVGPHPHEHLRLIAGVPWLQAKPHTLGVDLALEWADPLDSLPTLSFGDNPASEGVVASKINGRRAGNPIQYFHTRWHDPAGGQENALPSGVTIREALDSPSDLLPVVERTWAA